MIIEILGRPVSKKNSKQVFYKNGKMIVIPSKAYVTFKKDAGKQLLQYQRQLLKGKLFIRYVFYQKGKLRQDFDNAIGSINDILQDFNYIENDKDILTGEFEIVTNAKEWKTILEINTCKNYVS